jgi:hypothetical protein
MVWDDVRVLVSESVYQKLRVKNPCIVVEIHENAKEKDEIINRHIIIYISIYDRYIVNISFVHMFEKNRSIC